MMFKNLCPFTQRRLQVVVRQTVLCTICCLFALQRGPRPDTFRYEYAQLAVIARSLRRGNLVQVLFQVFVRAFQAAF